ncbi:MAG: hypothetical protein KAZ87_10290 [Spirochaetes bacterium]|nr:hypothetical protein [Spirochaetota bacterium]
MSGFSIFSRFDLMLKRMMQRNLSGFWMNALTFSGIIAIYSFIASAFLPSSINSVFASFMFKISLIITLFFIFSYILWKIISRRMAFTLEKNFEKFSLYDFALILIPMTPIAQYILSNQESLTPLNSLIIFLLFAISIAVLGIVIPVLLSRIASKQLIITASLGFLSTLMLMAYVSASRGWDRKGDIGIQLLVMLILLIVLSLRKLIPSKITVLAVVAFFAANTVSGVLSKKPSEDTGEANTKFQVSTLLQNKEIKRKNDVLLIIFESYADFETLKYYGYDNTDQINFLKDSGFNVYKGIYSLGAPTEQSLSKLFNIDREVYRHKRYLAGGGAVQALLRKNGYKTYSVYHSSWYLRGLPLSQIESDYCFPLPQGVMDSKVLVKAVLMGEFTDTVSFEDVKYESFLEEKNKAIGRNSADPVMLYSHSCYPGHGPSGQGLTEEDQSKEREGYLGRINNANEEMRLNVEEILKKNPDSIVIFAGDHGPFMTKTGYGLSRGRGNFKASDLDRYDIQDRFGMFLAIKWPDKTAAEKYDIKILQDVFPAVFSYLYDDNSIFDALRLKRMTKDNHRTLGVYVEDGIIHGGKDDGQKLFIME